MTAFEDGAVNLMHNDATKLSTTATGVSVTGLMASTTATADSATITNIANSVLTAKVITGTSVTSTAATIDSATITNIANSVLTAKAITNTSLVGDSATITSIASNSINTNALIVDDITIDGSTISDAGDLTLDVGGDIILDADGDNIYMKAGGGNQSSFSFINGDVYLGVETQDKDFLIRGNDGGSTITALTLDMSEAGKATFNSDIITSGTIRVGNLNVDSADIIKISRDNISGRNGLAYNSSTGVFDLDSANTITTVKNALSTGTPTALTYDSGAGQFALNANHVLALIKTVDSNASGLNAATLDGQEGTHYRINVYNNSGSLLN